MLFQNIHLGDPLSKVSPAVGFLLLPLGRTAQPREESSASPSERPSAASQPTLSVLAQFLLLLPGGVPPNLHFFPVPLPLPSLLCTSPFLLPLRERGPRTALHNASLPLHTLHPRSRPRPASGRDFPLLFKAHAPPWARAPSSSCFWCLPPFSQDCLFLLSTQTFPNEVLASVANSFQTEPAFSRFFVSTSPPSVANFPPCRLASVPAW